MIKIDNIIAYYPSFERGGITKNLENFLNYCVKNKIKVSLITENIAWKESYNISKKVEIIKFKKKKARFIPRRILSSFYSISVVVQPLLRLKEKRLSFFSFQSNIVPIIFCKLLGVKIVIRNSEEIIGATKYADFKIFAYIIFFFKLFFYNFADGIIANSSKSKESLQKILINKKKVKLIFNPYLLKIIKIKRKKKEDLILSIGRLCKQKNFETIIKAFNLFQKKNDNYKLVILGHGPDKKKLVNLSKKLKIMKKVKFKGWVSDTSVYLKKCKIFILSSLYEGLPNSLIDAVNYEIPSISTKCSGAEDILNFNKGVYFNFKDYKELAKKMNIMVNNYEKSVEKIKLSKLKINRFFVKKQVEEYLKYLNNIA